MNYEEDLQALTEIIDISFNLILSHQIKILLEKYRNDFSKNNGFRQEIIELSKNNIQTVLDNMSQYYIKEVLGKYFSSNGIVLYITNELISKSYKYYLDMLDGVNSERWFQNANKKTTVKCLWCVWRFWFY